MNHGRPIRNVGLRRVSGRSGLTLLELMIVLIILAIVATVAIRSLEPQLESQRWQASARQLESVRQAVLGDTEKYQLDGTPLVSGFVADVGRLPRLGDPSGVSVEAGDPLSELWDVESPLASGFPFQIRIGPRQPVDYSHVRIPCGWRGPYLTLPVGSSRIDDPWGRPLNVEPSLDASSLRVSIEPPAQTVPPESDGPEVLDIDLGGGKVSVTATVLLDDSENAQVTAACLAPDPQTSLTTLAVIADEDDRAESVLFSQIPIGFRAVVVTANGQTQTRYLQVTHRGANLVFDFRTPVNN